MPSEHQDRRERCREATTETGSGKAAPAACRELPQLYIRLLPIIQSTGNTKSPTSPREISHHHHLLETSITMHLDGPQI